MHHACRQPESCMAIATNICSEVLTVPAAYVSRDCSTHQLQHIILNAVCTLTTVCILTAACFDCRHASCETGKCSVHSNIWYTDATWHVIWEPVHRLVRLQEQQSHMYRKATDHEAQQSTLPVCDYINRLMVQARGHETQRSPLVAELP